MGKYENLKVGLIFGAAIGIGLQLIRLYEATYDVPFILPLSEIGGPWLWFLGWTSIIGLITAVVLKKHL